MSDLLLAFAAALGLTIALLPFARRAGELWGLHAYPSSDRWHTLPVPHTGGVAMVVAVIFAVWLGGAMTSLAPIILAASVMFALGLIDDVWSLPPWLRLTVQVGAAGMVLALVPPISITGWHEADWLLSVVWIVGLTNAVNLIDNIDGLATGVVGIAAAGVLGMLWISPEPHVSGLPVLLVALSGTAAGFLAFNFPPARVFMGNSGSYLLGSVIGTATLLAATGVRPASGGIAAAVLVLTVPILDTVFVTVTRGLARRSAFRGGRDHLSHRLSAVGCGDRDAMFVLWGVAAAGSAAACGLLMWPTVVAWGVAGLYLCSLVLIGLVVAQVPVDRTAASMPFPGELLSRHRPHAVVLDGLLLVSAYAIAYVIRFREPELSGFLPQFLRSLPIVVGLELGALWICGNYRGAAGNPGMRTLLQGSFLGVVASVVAVLYLARFEGYSRVVFAVNALLAPAMLLISRTLLAALDRVLHLRRSGGRGAIIYGAGRGGAVAARELRRNPELGLAPIGFIDDDPAKRWMLVEGLSVLGSVDSLAALLDRRPAVIAAVILSVDHLPAAKRDLVADLCEARAIELRQVHFSLEQVPHRRGSTRAVVGFPTRISRRPPTS
jgi:UDP-GlcNAc:undecaprenyl-phosphate GlcNAc-1-phosphate transferase